MQVLDVDVALDQWVKHPHAKVFFSRREDCQVRENKGVSSRLAVSHSSACVASAGLVIGEILMTRARGERANSCWKFRIINKPVPAFLASRIHDKERAGNSYKDQI